MAGRSKRVTIRTVAEDAGVSVAAVSKVLRNSYGVSARMREKVEASMDKLGYRPHTAARGLRGKTYTVGLLQNDLRNPYLPNIFDGLFEGFQDTGYQPLLGVGQSEVPLETALIHSMIDRQMDGLVMIGPRLKGDQIERFAEQIPICAVAHHDETETRFDTVNFDDHAGAEIAVDHLLSQGCKRVVMLSQYLPEVSGNNVIDQREGGFIDAMRSKGAVFDEESIFHALPGEEETRRAVEQILQMPSPPDGLFCWSDMVAMQVFLVAKAMGISIPDQMAVVGFDNTFDDRLRQHGLSSLNQSGHQLGLEAARLLLERIEGRSEARHTLYQPELVVRSSSQRKPL